MLPALCIAAGLGTRERAEDFDALWHAIDTDYAYIANGDPAWKAARARWRPKALATDSLEAFVAVLAAMLNELHDDHVGLTERATGARRIPFETDVWPRWDGKSVSIEAVRVFSDADVAGLRPGLVVTQIDELPVERAVAARLRGHTKEGIAARDWAVRQALAGADRIEVRDGRVERTVIVDHAARHTNGPAIVARRIGPDRDIGYLRIRFGATQTETIAAAFDTVAGTRALIVDVRDNVGPGSREMTLGVLGRFVDRERPWQLRADRRGRRATDVVAPVADAYRAPVVVLVDRWTAGEGEALAAGLRSVAGARLVGTRTAGLRGELHEVRLPHAGVTARYPGERTFSTDGKPRDGLTPSILVDLAAPKGGAGDPILYQALKLLEKK